MTSTFNERVDGVTASIAIKAPVKLATTENITLSGEQTIDGVSASAGTPGVTLPDRVLVKDQDDATENGIYDVSETAWTRAKDFNGTRDCTYSTTVRVSYGTTNANSVWRYSGDSPVSFGSSSITFELEAFSPLRWDDLRFPAVGIALGGVTSPPGQATDGSLLFDSDVAETIAGIAQMPHGWKEGSTIRPHIHWMKTTSDSGDVRWAFRYKIADVGDVFTGWSEWDYQETPLVGIGDVANTHGITSFTPIDMTTYSISCIILWQLGRDAGDDDDTYAEDAKLLEFDIHYQIDASGSAQQFTK